MDPARFSFTSLEPLPFLLLLLFLRHLVLLVISPFLLLCFRFDPFAPELELDGLPGRGYFCL